MHLLLRIQRYIASRTAVLSGAVTPRAQQNPLASRLRRDLPLLMIAEHLRVSLSLCIVLIGITVSACSQDPDVKKRQYLERGTAYHADGKYNEAIIQLKNALQIDP